RSSSRSRYGRNKRRRPICFRGGDFQVRFTERSFLNGGEYDEEKPKMPVVSVHRSPRAKRARKADRTGLNVAGWRSVIDLVRGYSAITSPWQGRKTVPQPQGPASIGDRPLHGPRGPVICPERVLFPPPRCRPRRRRKAFRHPLGSAATPRRAGRSSPVCPRPP